jgi:hypothetical protein
LPWLLQKIVMVQLGREVWFTWELGFLFIAGVRTLKSQEAPPSLFVNCVEFLSHRPLKEVNNEATGKKFKFQSWFGFTRYKDKGKSTLPSPCYLHLTSIIQLPELFFWCSIPTFGSLVWRPSMSAKFKSPCWPSIRSIRSYHRIGTFYLVKLVWLSSTFPLLCYRW